MFELVKWVERPPDMPYEPAGAPEVPPPAVAPAVAPVAARPTVYAVNSGAPVAGPAVPVAAAVGDDPFGGDADDEVGLLL